MTSSWMCRRAHRRFSADPALLGASSPTSSTSDHRRKHLSGPRRGRGRRRPRVAWVVDRGKGIGADDRGACSTRSNVSTTRASQRCRGGTGIGRRSRVRAGHARRAHGRRHTRGRHDDDRRARGLPMSRVLVVDDEAPILRALTCGPASPQVRVGCRRDRRGRSPARRQAPSRRSCSIWGCRA